MDGTMQDQIGIGWYGYYMQDRIGWFGWYMQDQTGWYLPSYYQYPCKVPYRSISKSLYLFQSAYSRGRKRNVRVSIPKECASVKAQCFVRMRCNKEPVCKAWGLAFSCQTSAISIPFTSIPWHICTYRTHMLMFKGLLLGAETSCVCVCTKRVYVKFTEPKVCTVGIYSTYESRYLYSLGEYI